MELQPIPLDPRKRPWGVRDRHLAGLVASHIKHTMSDHTYMQVVIDPWWPQRAEPSPPVVRKVGKSIAGTALIFGVTLALVAFARS